jgi:hypothetical protein
MVPRGGGTYTGKVWLDYGSNENDTQISILVERVDVGS